MEGSGWGGLESNGLDKNGKNTEWKERMNEKICEMKKKRRGKAKEGEVRRVEVR